MNADLHAIAEIDAQVRSTLLECVEHFGASESAEVRLAAVAALGWRADDRARAIVLRAASDGDPAVRREAIARLPRQFDAASPDARIVSTLLAGLDDEDADVRDWSAFGLGIVAVDTPEVRDALVDHLDDEGANTSGEAAVSLAILGDARVVPVLLDWLSREEVGDLWVEAAGELGDPRLLPLLERLRAHGWDTDERIARPSVLAEAIERCSPAG